MKPTNTGLLATKAEKVCEHCGESKPVESFPSDKRRKDGLYPYCRTCRILKQKSYRKQDDSKDLNGRKCLLCLEPVRGHLNRKYCSEYCKGRAATVTKHFGLTLPEYRALLEDCHGLCPICHCQMSKQPIDHNHVTMEVTGIVCTRCNIGLLSYSRHDPEIAKRLFEYLSDPPAQRVTGRTVRVNPIYFQEASNIHTAWKKRGARR